jgi:hypothetical protein
MTPLALMRRCHARGCTRLTDSRFFICELHWRHVSPGMRTMLDACARPGQERDGKVYAVYVAAEAVVVAAVAVLGTRMWTVEQGASHATAVIRTLIEQGKLKLCDLEWLARFDPTFAAFIAHARNGGIGPA